MDVSSVLVLVAAILFGVEAVMSKSLVAAGLCLFALSFVVKVLL